MGISYIYKRQQEYTNYEQPSLPIQVKKMIDDIDKYDHIAAIDADKLARKYKLNDTDVTKFKETFQDIQTSHEEVKLYMKKYPDGTGPNYEVDKYIAVCKIFYINVELNRKYREQIVTKMNNTINIS